MLHHSPCRISIMKPLLLIVMDVVLVCAIHLAQPPIILHHPFISLWVGGLIRAGLFLLLFIATSPNKVSWMSSFEGLQTLLVLCFHCPLYISLLWLSGQSTLEQVTGWHSWQRILQSYGVTLVAWLYWKRFTSSVLTGLQQSAEPQENSSGSLKRLIGYMVPYASHFTIVLLLVFLSSYGEMAFPRFTGNIADWILNDDKPDAFKDAITDMALMTIGSAVLEFIGDLIYTITMSRIHVVVQCLIFSSVLKQEIAFFESTQIGELVSHVTTDTNTISENLSEQLSLLMWYFFRLGFLLFFMIGQSWKMSLFSCMGLPIIWVIPEISGYYHQSISKKVQASLAEAQKVATETFSNMKTVRSFANEDGETKKYKKCLDDTYAHNKKEAVSYAVSTCATSMSSLALKVVILYYGGTLVTSGTVSRGDLVAFILYELQFASSVEAVMTSYPEVKKAVGASHKIFEYLDREPKLPPEGNLSPEHLNGHIEFRNVSFAYPGRKDKLILKDVSLEIKPGKVTALVGLNGSGKSSFVKLLERFYQPQAGQILLDGEPLTNYKNQYLHDKIAVVSQECVLFSRSVKENIKYGCETASDEEMYNAVKQAWAHDFISELSNGYETDAGEKGGQVSGGQKQRIAIARALIRKPKILILDNATSDLDSETEAMINSAILDEMRERSILLISHKLSALKKAAHIVVLNEGKVEEEGTHDDLMKIGGLYADLFGEKNVVFRHEEEGDGRDAY